MDAITSALQVAVDVNLYKTTKDMAKDQATTMLQDFSSSQPAPHPYLGRSLDVRF